MNRQRTVLNVIIGIVIAAFSIVAVYSGINIITELVTNNLSDDATAQHEGYTKTIEKNGVRYFPRQDLTVFLLMGIDREGPVVKSESYNNDGAADVVSLVVFDDTAKTFSVLMLNRDTMTKMQVLGIGGKPADTITAQLALSHTYGSGMEDSCENVKTAVSDLLCGIEIDYYMSMNMDAISILNDSVGGVTVNVTDDFSEIDSSIPKGSVRLTGAQALSFVRNRKGVGDQLNVSRMERQKEYMYGFMNAVRTASETNGNLTTDVYSSIKPYIVSDCSVSNFTNLVNRCSDYTLSEIVTPEGENVKGEQYMEYHVDEDATEDLALRLFYSEKPTID